jgi:hypothetical protein
VGQNVRFRGDGDIAGRSSVCCCAVPGPFACFGAVVCGFGSVVEAVFAGEDVSKVALRRLECAKRALPFTALTSEGK